MGLDMYLYKDIFVGANYEHRKVTGTIELFTDGRKINVDLSKLSSIKEQVAYWRKANAIHNWFVINVQEGKDECQESYVDIEQLKTLLDTVSKVLEDHNLAEQLLPTQSGFFFGQYSYDEWYFEQFAYTKTALEEAIKNKDDDGEFYYHASW